ncbi:MAG: Uma2 family endonuclease [Chloroflexi bacterium]|nr:Uma2 family endonuclease [Chloroflexota bacterium]
MTAVISKPREAPQRLKISYEEYLDFATTSQIVEWVDGEAITYMPPIFEHQSIAGFLFSLLNTFVRQFELGEMIVAPFEVKLWPDGPSREPDIIYISQNNLQNLTDKRFVGAPDLLVEVISPGSVTEDRVRKFTEYEQAGVLEYWLIDPRQRQKQVDCYVLGEDGEFHDAAVGEDGRYHAAILPHFWFQIDWLWQEKLPNPQLALAEILLTVPTLSAEARQVYKSLYKLLHK